MPDDIENHLDKRSVRVSLAVIVLAAGLGTRMKSATPKVLHPLLGKPVITHVLDAVAPLKPSKIVVVINPQGTMVRDALAGREITFAVQKEMKGTGDAVKTAARCLAGFTGTILIVNGDTPLLATASLKRFVKLHVSRKETVSLLSFLAEPPHEYGRILRERGQMVGIVEHRDATEEQRAIREVNSGVYAMQAHALTLLKHIKENASKGEYYLTDIVDIAVRKGLKTGAHVIGAAEEYTGINTRQDLHEAALVLRRAIASKWMLNGVTIMDRDSVFIDPEATIGTDTVIYPNVHIEGRTIVGANCTIYPNCRIINSTLGDTVTIKDTTLIENSAIGDHAAVGPFAHIRPATIIGENAKIGNFVEIKKSTIGAGSKASHLSYIGDAEVGKGVNIGAGTITCNYDGVFKHKTVLEDGVFIGSDSQLVAPVTVGKHAYVGAGSTITENVPSDALALSRARQVNIDGWVPRHAQKMQEKKTAAKGASRGR